MSGNNENHKRSVFSSLVFVFIKSYHYYILFIDNVVQVLYLKIFQGHHC